MTHILRINEMAKFGRRSIADIENADIAMKVSDEYGKILSELQNEITAPLYLFTKEDLKKAGFRFDIYNFFDDKSGIIGDDKGEYRNKKACLVAVEKMETDSEYSFTAYVLAVFGYDDSTEGVDSGYLDRQMKSGELKNDVYNALKTVKTDAFYGRQWDPDDLSETDYIYIPIRIGIEKKDLKDSEKVIAKNIRETVLAADNALCKAFEGYLIKNNPQGV